MSTTKLLDHWAPPDGAGAPIACLATTFTFEADFFTQDCLSRFLSLSMVTSEGDAISSIAAILEEEERLGETQVSVLVDRSSPAEKRNLRWDLLPVTVRGGLLHGKVSLLLWERSARIILGSANLTSAGYRRQVELALVIDLDDRCQVPRPIFDDLVDELRRLVDLAPGPPSGPKGRALKTIDILDARIASIDLPSRSSRDLLLALAPARPGVSPLDRMDEVWRGPQPLWATVLSPFWDDQVPAPAIQAVHNQLTGRPASRRTMTLVVAVDPFNGTVKAPPSLGLQNDVDIVAFDPPDSEPRSLHGKLLLVESDEWCAAMIGSSNATGAGYGLNRFHGHQELNLWLGCPATSPTARYLRDLARAGDRIDVTTEKCEPIRDEDEPTTPVLSTAFVSCVIDASTPPHATMEFDLNQLPAVWEVRTPIGSVICDANSWKVAGSSPSHRVPLPAEPLPAYLVVRWDADGQSLEATWTANVEDRGALPPPAELSGLPVDVLLAALASTRPLPVALEHELRRRERVDSQSGQVDLDPLRRFDDSGLLLQRTRHLSLALWRLQERLSRPATSLDAIQWRLNGALGPLTIADGLVAAAQQDETLPGEAHFLLAELALTIAAVNWVHVAGELDYAAVRRVVREVLAGLEERRQRLHAAPDAGLDTYVREAIRKARR